MTNGQVVQVIALLVSLEVTGILLGFLIAYILYKGQIEFTEMMYQNEEKHNQKLFEEVRHLGDLNLEYERRIKKMTLIKYLDSHTVKEILKEDDDGND